jgi:hypothetical protein
MKRKQPLPNIESPIKQEKKKTLPSEEFPLDKKIFLARRVNLFIPARALGK